MVSLATPSREPVVLLLGGPTASGKSALAVAAANALDGVIVNADSMQIYREMSRITARPDEAELKAAPHRLYGVRPMAEPCNAAAWRSLALAEIAEAQASGKLVIMTGGSGLYFRALRHGLAPVPPIPAEVDAAARARLDAYGVEALHAALVVRDPESAARLSPGDTQRVLRAWEVLEATGRSLAAWQREPTAYGAPAGRLGKLVIEPEREVLYAACNARFAEIAAQGGVEEARAIAALKLNPALPAMKAVGLRELIGLAAGRTSRETALEAGMRATRRYAKRQLTWFRHQMAGAVRIEERVTPGTLERALAVVSRIVLTDSA